MLDKKSFNKLFEEKLAPVIAELDKERSGLQKRRSTIYAFISIGVIAFIALCIPSGYRLVFFFILMTSFGVAGTLDRKFRVDLKRYNKKFKEKVIGEMICSIDPNFSYFPENKVPEYFYDKSDIYPEGYDVYIGDDYVEGKIGKTQFLFSELDVLRRRGDNSDSDMAELFKGIFFVADFNKNFLGRTYVWDKSERAFNILNKKNFPFTVDLQKVLLESKEFMDRFVVFSNDQVEARYILSPTLMDAMVRLSNEWDRNISFSFVDSNIMIAIPIRQDLFEPDISFPPSAESLSWYYELIVMMTGIIEELNLNLRIWNRN